MYGGMRIPEGSPNAIPIKLNFPSNRPEMPPVPMAKPMMETTNLASYDDNQIGFGSLRKPSL